MFFTYNCAASGLVFIMVNNFCIWWSCRTLITSGSDRISCILAWSSGDGGTGGCCLALALSVSPMSLSWLTVDFYGNMILSQNWSEIWIDGFTKTKANSEVHQFNAIMKWKFAWFRLTKMLLPVRLWMMKLSTFSQLSFMHSLEKYVQRTKLGQLLRQWILCSVIPTT